MIPCGKGFWRMCNRTEDEKPVEILTFTEMCSNIN